MTTVSESQIEQQLEKAARELAPQIRQFDERFHNITEAVQQGNYTNVSKEDVAELSKYWAQCQPLMSEIATLVGVSNPA